MRFSLLIALLSSFSSLLEKSFVNGLKCQKILDVKSVFIPPEVAYNLTEECGPTEDKCVRANVFSKSAGHFDGRTCFS